MVTAIIAGVIVGVIFGVIGVAVKVVEYKVLKDILVSAFSINNFDAVKNFDVPYITISETVLKLFVNFVDCATALATICCFLCIIFNAFKLWAGTTEVKKAFLDVLYKSVMVVFAMNFFPIVALKGYQGATELGASLAGGPEVVLSTYNQLAYKIGNIFKTVGTAYANALKENGAAGLTDANGNIIVTQKSLDVFREMGMSESAAEAYLKSNGFKVLTPNELSKINQYQNENEAAKKLQSAEVKRFGKDLDFMTKINEQQAREDEVQANMELWDPKMQKQIKQNLSIIRAMGKTLGGLGYAYKKKITGQMTATERAQREAQLNSEEEMLKRFTADVVVNGEKALKKLFYSPFINKSTILSTSAMVKVSMIIAEMTASGSWSDFDYDNGYKKSVSGLMESEDSGIFVGWLGGLVKQVIYRLGVIIAMIYVMLEYVITIIEYLIVISVSMLLIPLFFIDATKQFATNVLRTLLTYLIKILVVTMLVFFTLRLYMDLGIKMLGRSELSSISSILIYVFTLIFGMVFIKSGSKIASAVISGNPSMGLGDVAHQVRGMSHSMHMARGAVNSVNGIAKKAAQGAQSGINAGRQTYANWRSAQTAAADKRADVIKEKGDEVSQHHVDTAGNRAALKSFFSSFGHNVQSGVHKKLTGQEKIFADKDGSINMDLQPLTVGQQFKDKNNDNIMRIATAADVINRNREIEAAKRNKPEEKNSDEVLYGDEFSSKVSEPVNRPIPTNLHPSVAPGEEPSRR